MPNETALDNPKGAFGYLTATNTPTQGGPQGIKTRVFRNASTQDPIRFGDVVVLHLTSSTASGVDAVSTVFDGAHRTTILGAPAIAGVAMTTAARRSTGTTWAVGGAPSSEYFTVITEGPAWTNFSTIAAGVPAVGQAVIVSNSTLTTAVGSSAGGLAEGLTTLLTTGAVAGILGFCKIAGSTGSTGFLDTAITRGLVWVQPSVFRNQGANSSA